MKKNYPLASSSWGMEEIEAINRVIASDMFTMGKEVQEYEELFAEYVGSKYCLMVNSGSSANLLAVASLFYKKTNALVAGDEVIVPAVSWATTYFPLYQYGLKLKFVDIDINTLNYNLETLKEAINNNTRMIVVVNLLGNPNDFEEIQSLIGERDIILLEDNCESLGAEYNGKQAGTFGVMGTYSSFFSHHISTMEGGMIVTNNLELYHILLSLRSHGWTRHLPQINCLVGSKKDNPFEESFRFVLPGYNVRPIEFNGAIGKEQLKKLPEFLAHRRKNALLFQQLFADNEFYLIQKEIGSSSWFGFSFIIKEGAPFNRNEVITKLNKNNIDCRPIVAGNFAKNEVLKWFNYEIYGSLENAELVDQNGFFVGNHHFDITDQLHRLKETLMG